MLTHQRSLNATILWRELALLLVLLVALLNFSKGFVSHIQPWVEAYWVINYKDGLIRRGFLGHILSFFYDQRTSNHVLQAAFFFYLITSMSLLACCWVWLRKLCKDQKDYQGLLAIFAVFATSQFLPTQAYDAGFLDVFDYILVLGAAVAALFNLYILVAIIGFVGPFIHEVFIVVWLSLVILVVWDGPTLRKLVLLSTVVAATAIVYFCPTKEAGIAQMAAAPLPQRVKGEMIEFQFGQTISSSLIIMSWKYRYYFDHFVFATMFFVFPTAMMIACYARMRESRRDFLYLIAATLAPATILIVAWDLSRFLVATAFSALLSIFYMQSVRPVLIGRSPITRLCWLVAAFYLMSPLVYAFFEKAFVIDLGIVRFENNPIGRLVKASIYPKFKAVSLPVGGPTTDVPGMEWEEEEGGAWIGRWVRRAGTNIFDATWTRGRSRVTAVLSITRAGDRIIVERSSSSDGNDMTYTGIISGTTVHGEYPGGRWVATIR